MTERPSTATGSNRNFNQALTSPLRPNTSGGPGISVTGASPTGSRTPPPNENRRSISGASSSPRPKAKGPLYSNPRNLIVRISAGPDTKQNLPIRFVETSQSTGIVVTKIRVRGQRLWMSWNRSLRSPQVAHSITIPIRKNSNLGADEGNST